MKITISNPVEIDGEPVAAASLEGAELPGGWRVGRILRARDQQHGTPRLSGCNFSFGYETVNADGQAAFCWTNFNGIVRPLTQPKSLLQQ